MIEQYQLGMLRLLFTSPSVFLRPKRYLFIFSHMRGFTTLMAHILGSHEQIDGYYENKINYHSSLSLLRLRYQLHRHFDRSTGSKWLLDKVVNNLKFSSEILTKKNVYQLYILRKPEDTLRSTINMSASITGTNRYSDPEVALEQYCTRLARLQECVQFDPAHRIYIDAEDIVNHPDRTLAFLTTALELTSPLSSEYSTFEHTGKRGFGDPSGNIGSGRVLKDRPAHGHVVLATDVVRQAQDMYKETRAVLCGRCWTMDR